MVEKERENKREIDSKESVAQSKQERESRLCTAAVKKMTTTKKTRDSSRDAAMRCDVRARVTAADEDSFETKRLITTQLLVVALLTYRLY
jgi:Tfp pilus assembly major pilin PilA